MREVWSFGINDKALHDNLRIIEIWSAPRPEGLGLGALNRLVCWETDKSTLKTWKVKTEKLWIKELVDRESMKAWRARPEYKKDK